MIDYYLTRAAAAAVAILLGLAGAKASDCAGCSAEVGYVPATVAQSGCCGSPVPENPVVGLTSSDVIGYDVIMDRVMMRRDRLDVVPPNPAWNGPIPGIGYVDTYDSVYFADAGYSFPPPPPPVSAGAMAYLDSDADAVYTAGTTAVYTPGKGGVYCENDVRLDYGTAPENTNVYNTTGVNKNDPRFSIDPRAATRGIPVSADERGADYGVPANEMRGDGMPPAGDACAPCEAASETAAADADSNDQGSRRRHRANAEMPINTTNDDQCDTPDVNASNPPAANDNQDNLDENESSQGNGSANPNDENGVQTTTGDGRNPNNNGAGVAPGNPSNPPPAFNSPASKPNPSQNRAGANNGPQGR